MGINVVFLKSELLQSNSLASVGKSEVALNQAFASLQKNARHILLPNNIALCKHVAVFACFPRCSRRQIGLRQWLDNTPLFFIALLCFSRLALIRKVKWWHAIQSYIVIVDGSTSPLMEYLLLPIWIVVRIIFCFEK